MNVERLHTIAATLLEDIENSGVAGHLEELAVALEQLAQQPGQPQFQERVSNALSALGDASARSSVDQWPAAWRETLEELGVADSLGSALLDQARTAVTANEITPQTAATTVRGRGFALGDIWGQTSL